DAIEEALAMPEVDRRARVEGMATHVDEMDGAIWARGFLARARRFIAERGAREGAARLDEATLQRLAADYAAAPAAALFLDYDGTLRELTRLPDEARPTEALRQLLAELASSPGVALHVVSGRDRRQLEAWLGDLPIHLAAEHGFAARPPGGAFEDLLDVDLSFLPRVVEVL